jgi:phospholipid/cholesterol/gamma-HCH transport system substrate-binding protein
MWASLSGGGTSIFDEKYEFQCYFRNVSGLLSGSPVWMAGVEVGNVSGVKFVNLDSLRTVRVTCAIKTEAWDMMTKGTEVQLGTIGLLGDKYVEILPGPMDKPVIARGSVVPTAEVGSAEEMFSAGTDALETAESLATNLDSVLARMNRGEGTLGRLAVDDTMYHQLTDLAAHLTRLAASLQQNQERITESVERTSGAVADLAEKVDNNSGTLGKLIADPKLYDNLAATSARLDSVMARIDRSQGSLGLLVSDTALYTETVNLMHRMNNLVTDIEENPGRYLKFSVF